MPVSSATQEAGAGQQPGPLSEISSQTQILKNDWRLISVVEHLPGMHKVLGSLPSSTKLNKMQNMHNKDDRIAIQSNKS